MNTVTYSIVLDAKRIGSQHTVDGFHTGESGARAIEITLVYDGKVYAVSPEQSVIAYCKNSEGSLFILNCTAEDGKIIFCPDSASLSVSGELLCQIEIFDTEGSIIFTPSFTVNIGESMRIAVPGESLGALENALNEVKTLKNELSDGVSVLSKMTESDGKLKFNGNPIGSLSVYNSYSELLDSGAAEEIAYVKRVESRHESRPLSLALRSEGGTDLRHMAVTVSKAVPAYNEERLREGIENAVSTHTDFFPAASIRCGEKESEIFVGLLDDGTDAQISSAPASTKISCISTDYLYCLVSNLREFPSADESGYTIIMYVYFYGNAHVHMEINGCLLDSETFEGWYAVAGKFSSDGAMTDIKAFRTDNTDLISITTDETGCGQSENPASKDLLDGVFTGEGSFLRYAGIYVKGSEWTNTLRAESV